MAIALEARGVNKSYRAGSGSCFASTRVLRDIDLIVHAGEAVGVLGDRGAGKTTLLLCLAGLLGPDAGAVRWFGDAAPASAARHVLYHSTHADLMRSGSDRCGHIHLVDVPALCRLSADLGGWIETRKLDGHAVVVAARDRSALPVDMPVLSLTRGRLRRARDDQARVAEASVVSG